MRCSPSRRLPLDALCFGALSLCLGAASLSGCKESGGGVASESTTAAPKAEPERFSFSLPGEYTSLELSGEGSEALKAPPGASARRADDKRISVDAGPDFALDVSAEAPPLAELLRGAGAVERVLEERDLVIFKSPAGYAFVMVRELVPEWDENQPQRFACTSRGAALGGAAPRADMTRFSRDAVQKMVAACRTLQLPKLE